VILTPGYELLHHPHLFHNLQQQELSATEILELKALERLQRKWSKDDDYV